MALAMAQGPASKTRSPQTGWEVAMTVPMIDTVSKSAGTITRRCRRNRPCQTSPLYGPEHLFIGAIALQPALADVVPQAVQRQLARFDLLRHKGERHQVLK